MNTDVYLQNISNAKRNKALSCSYHRYKFKRKKETLSKYARIFNANESFNTLLFMEDIRKVFIDGLYN